MLVLTLKPGESAVLSNGVLVHLSKVKQGAARIGIEAPDNVRILREPFLPPTLVQRMYEGLATQDEIDLAFAEAAVARRTAK